MARRFISDLKSGERVDDEVFLIRSKDLRTRGVDEPVGMGVSCGIGGGHGGLLFLGVAARR